MPSPVKQNFWNDKQEQQEPGPIWLNKEEFQQKYQMGKASFKKILEMIKDHPLFDSGGKKKQQNPQTQLVVPLKFSWD